jgi:hypothetical protein
MPVWMIAAQAAFQAGPFARADALVVPAPPNLDQVPYRQFELAEFDSGITASFGNPFDPRDIAVDLEIESPQRAYRVPAYFDTAAEPDATTRPGGFRVRWTPRESGPHRLRWIVRTRTESRTGDPVSVEVPDGTAAGFIIPSEQNPRYLQRENGPMPFPIGVNLPPALPAAGDFTETFERFARAGINLVATTVQPNLNPFALERMGKPAEGHGLGHYDVRAAQRLDRLFRDAARRRINVWLNLDHARSLRPREPDAAWDQSPYNSDQGGPLRIWSDFWTDDIMRIRSEARLRYLVARYGAMPNLIGWELWAAVDRVSDFDPEIAIGWHQRTARFLREIDPYLHPIGTTAAEARGVRVLDALPELDIVSTAIDERADPTGTIADQLARKSNFGKPQWIAEAAPAGLADPGRFLRRDPLWISVVAGAAGATRVTLSAEDINSTDVDALRPFRSIADFTRGIDFAGQEMRPTPISVTYADRKPRTRRRSLEIQGVPIETLAFRLPPRIQVNKSGAVVGAPPNVLPGAGSRPPGGLPVTFRTAFGINVTFDLLVASVGPGAANLEILVDGESVRRTVLNPGRFDLPRAVSTVIPAGYHNVTVRNVGPGDAALSYRFRDAIPITRPPVQAWASHGARHILLWMRHEDMTWQHVAVRRRTVPTAPPVILQLRGLAAGNYAVTRIQPETATSAPDGALRVPALGVATFRPAPFTGTIAYRFDRSTP